MRNTNEITITAKGRDQGKVFVLTEMPARQAEKWATRALLALSRSGVDVPENALRAGMLGLVSLGLSALPGLNFADAEPLLDEMMACVQIMPDPTKPAIVRKLINDDIEEVVTILSLRGGLLELHVGFSLADLKSMFQEMARISNMPNTEVSETPAEPLSPQD